MAIPKIGCFALIALAFGTVMATEMGISSATLPTKYAVPLTLLMFVGLLVSVKIRAVKMPVRLIFIFFTAVMGVLMRPPIFSISEIISIALFFLTLGFFLTTDWFLVRAQSIAQG